MNSGSVVGSHAYATNARHRVASAGTFLTRIHSAWSCHVPPAASRVSHGRRAIATGVVSGGSGRGRPGVVAGAGPGSSAVSSTCALQISSGPCRKARDTEANVRPRWSCSTWASSVPSHVPERTNNVCRDWTRFPGCRRSARATCWPSS